MNLPSSALLIAHVFFDLFPHCLRPCLVSFVYVVCVYVVSYCMPGYYRVSCVFVLRGAERCLRNSVSSTCKDGSHKCEEVDATCELA